MCNTYFYDEWIYYNYTVADNEVFLSFRIVNIVIDFFSLKKISEEKSVKYIFPSLKFVNLRYTGYK